MHWPVQFMFVYTYARLVSNEIFNNGPHAQHEGQIETTAKSLNICCSRKISATDN